MATTLSIEAAEPETWPDAPSGLSDAAAALAPGMVWARLESWIAWRWGERDVVFITEGPGEWRPPLRPATVETVEVWTADAWTNAVLRPSPRGGYMLEGEGPYRFSGTVGADVDPPAAVLEAFRRLAEYSAEIGRDGAAPGHPSHSSHSVNIGGAIQETFSRPSTWAARAIHNSGAADLLRPWRELGAN